MKQYSIIIYFLSIACATSAFANVNSRSYFADHVPVQPGKQLAISYAFPSPNHTIECHQDSPLSRLGTVEWTFQGVKFTGQIGDMRRVTLASSPIPYGIWVEQSADATGVLVFKNLDDKAELQVTCSYQESMEE